MSHVVDEKKSEKKKVNVNRFIVTLSLDGAIVAAGPVEGAGSSQDAFERSLRWFLIYRSKYIPNLVMNDVFPLAESLQGDMCEIPVENDEEAIARWEVKIPIKDTEGNITSHKTLTAIFFEYGFIQF